MASPLSSAQDFLPDHFKALPAVQEEIAFTGLLAVREASKEFKSIFDLGLCRVWNHLKKDAYSNFNFIAFFMVAIEQRYGPPTQENALRLFQALKSRVHATWNKHLVFVDPSVDIPTQIFSFGLLGLEFRETIASVKVVKSRAQEISQLRLAFQKLCPSGIVPTSFLDPKTGSIMSFPLLDASHPRFKQAMKGEENPLQRTHEEGIRDLCHPREKEPVYKECLQVVFPSLQACPVCKHIPEHEESLIDVVLQEEILIFLRSAVSQAAVQHKTKPSESVFWNWKSLITVFYNKVHR